MSWSELKIIVGSIGRLKRGPEQELAQRYADRIRKTGRAVGIAALNFIELPESRATDAITRKREEAYSVLARLPEKVVIFAFDERGQSPSSRQFAATLSEHFDGSTMDIACIIGGPDGLDSQLREKASLVVSFGALTIPHQMVRILVLEQIYRAITILTNHPYHRD